MQKFILVISFLIFGVLVSPCVRLANASGSPVAVNEGCGQWKDNKGLLCPPGGHPVSPRFSRPRSLFQDLKRVILIVQILRPIQSTIDCVNENYSCVEEAAKGEQGFNKDSYRKLVDSSFHLLPAELHTDNLVSVFGDIIYDEIVPYIDPHASGANTLLEVIQRKPKLDADGEINDKGTLTVAIRLRADGARASCI